MHCEQCGTAAIPTAKFCHKCGHQLQAPVIDLVQSQNTEEPENHQKPSAAATTSSEGSVGDQVIESVRLKVEVPEIHQESSAEATCTPKKFLGAHHPWRRFLARTTDMALAAPLLYLLLFYPIWEVPFVESLLGTDGGLGFLNHPFVIGMLIFLLWAPIEAAFLSAFGATFGKWAFGIRVLDSDGKRLAYGKAFLRSFNVLVFGMGFGIPFVNMITCLFSYNKLAKTGSTNWDFNVNADDKILVSHQPWTLGRGLICSFAVFLTLMSGALTPVIVAKLITNYWAGQGKLSPLASPPNAAQTGNATEAADKQAKRETYFTCLRDWHKQNEAEWRMRIAENYDAGYISPFDVRNYPDILACEHLMGSYIFPTEIVGRLEFRECVRDWQKKNNAIWARFEKANTTINKSKQRQWNKGAIEWRPDFKACKQVMPVRIVEDKCSNVPPDQAKSCLMIWEMAYQR